MSTKNWEKRFDAQYPAFEGVGAPFPLFKSTPNRNHIIQFIDRELKEQREEVREWARKKKEGHGILHGTIDCEPCLLDELLSSLQDPTT